MKKLLFFLCLSSVGLLAQIQVTTITPQIKGSGGLSLDDDGNLIIADFGDFLSVPDPDGLPNDIFVMDPDFNITQYATDFEGASGNDFDSNGVLFQSDIRAGGIYKIIGGVRTLVTTTGIVGPVGIVFDSQGNFFVCNCGNNTIRKVTPGGVSTNFAPSNLYQCPNGITVDEDDNLYVANFGNGSIIKITPGGNATLLNATPGGTTSGPSSGHLDYFQPTRTLFITGVGSNKIYSMRIDDPSSLTALVGSGVRGNADGDAGSASFSRPNGIAVTQTGDSIYVNSSIPVTNVPNGPLNPSVIRLITGVNSVLSVSENSALFNDLKAYPNPAKNSFTIEALMNKDYSALSIRVHDIQGKLVKEINKVSTLGFRLKQTIDISHLNSGYYFYSLYVKNESILNGKLIKE